MSLITNERVVGIVVIVDFSGRITDGESAGVLRDTIRQLLSRGSKAILLNLTDVSYMDNSGLGELVSGYTTSTNQGAKIKLLTVRKRIDDLLQITALDKVFDSFEDEGLAVASFS